MGAIVRIDRIALELNRQCSITITSLCFAVSKFITAGFISIIAAIEDFPQPRNTKHDVSEEALSKQGHPYNTGQMPAGSGC